MKKKPLIVLTGPTAVGKTELSVRLAKAIDGEIISADSMQVYRGMDIGTAKITPAQMQGVRHHLIDVLEPQQDFHVVLFQQMAKEALEEIYAAGRIPIVAGGTGFYIQALLYDIDFTQNREDDSCRRELEALAREKGSGYLHRMLEEKDPDSATIIHENNVKRVIRALEYYYQCSAPISEHNAAQRQKESPYHFAYFVLNDHREKLYARIEKRVDDMLAQGLVQEVEKLLAGGCKRESTAMQGLGYKEIIRYLDGEIPLEEAVRILKRDTRHFAKRQITWFKRERQVSFLEYPDFDYEPEKILAEILQQLKQKEIIHGTAKSINGEAI